MIQKNFGIFFLFLVSFSSLGQADIGTTGGLTLQRTIPARPSGLGEAYVALADDIQTFAFNPAGYAQLTDTELTTTLFRGLDDDNLGFVGYAQPNKIGALFVGGAYFDGGDIDLNLSNGVTGKRKAQQDLVGIVGLGIGNKGPISLGANAKYYSFELAETATANGLALDGGVLWKTPFKGIQLGGSIQNVGSDIKFEQEGDPLPQTLRLGGAYQKEWYPKTAWATGPMALILVVDAVKLKDTDFEGHGGLEFKKKFGPQHSLRSFSIRGGYISDPRTVTFGAGIQYSRVSFDYAVHLLREVEDETHRVTLGIRLGKIKEKEAFQGRRIGY